MRKKFVIFMSIAVVAVTSGQYCTAGNEDSKQEYGVQKLSLKDTKKQVEFGFPQEQAEKLFSKKAFGNGFDEKEIEIPGVILVFDKERLYEIKYGKGFDFSIPLTPFKEQWRNPPVFSDIKISYAMSYDDVKKYIDKWAARLVESGYTKKDKGEELGEKEFLIQRNVNEYMNDIAIHMGPTRKTKGGGVWADVWRFSFTNKYADFKIGNNKLYEISAFEDDYNTKGRGKKN